MKKFLTIIALAGVMAACNNGDDDTTDGDSATGGDTMNMTTPSTPGDTMGAGTSDTMNRGTDTMLKK